MLQIAEAGLLSEPDAGTGGVDTSVAIPGISGDGDEPASGSQHHEAGPIERIRRWRRGQVGLRCDDDEVNGSDVLADYLSEGFGGAGRHLCQGSFCFVE